MLQCPQLGMLSIPSSIGVLHNSCHMDSKVSKKDSRYSNLNQNSQAVKKECGPQGEKRCEIQGGGQEMAVMVG